MNNNYEAMEKVIDFLKECRSNHVDCFVDRSFNDIVCFQIGETCIEFLNCRMYYKPTKLYDYLYWIAYFMNNQMNVCCEFVMM